jgi:hypothetical protein
MEQQLNYEEWFFQSDYDLETAQHMIQSGRNVYCIFMCHLSLEKQYSNGSRTSDKRQGNSS